MLKSFTLPVNYHNQISKTCGEIICENQDDFIINCKLCKLKIFEYQEFIRHFKNIHLNETLEQQPTQFGKVNLEYIQKDQHGIEFENESVKLESEKVGSHENSLDETHWQAGDNDHSDSDEYTNTTDEETNNNYEESITIMKKPKKPKEFACGKCGKKYADSRRLQLHVTLAHTKWKPYKCSVCDKGFTEEGLLQRHIRFKHTGYECPKCQKNFRSNQSLKRHNLIHLNIKNFICDADNCGKAFITKGQLTKHQLLHTTEMFICDECGYKCRKKESLVVHKRNHAGEKPFGCNLCKSRFASKSLLTEHMASHETERKHVCDVCGKAFNRPKALYHHKHLHLGIKKFVCKICGQAYAQAAGLSAHMRKHREVIASIIAPQFTSLK